MGEASGGFPRFRGFFSWYVCLCSSCFLFLTVFFWIFPVTCLSGPCLTSVSSVVCLSLPSVFVVSDLSLIVGIGLCGVPSSLSVFWNSFTDVFLLTEDYERAISCTHRALECWKYRYPFPYYTKNRREVHRPRESTSPSTDFIAMYKTTLHELIPECLKYPFRSIWGE